MLDGPFHGSTALSRGLLTRAQLYGPRFRRLLPDVHVPAELPIDHAVRSRAAYLLVQTRGGILCGFSAATLLGAGCGPPNAPAEVLVDHDLRRHPGLRVHRGRACGEDVRDVGGCRVTAPLRTAWDLARRSLLVDAVVAVDALARCGEFAPDALLARRREQPGARGARRLEQVVELADPRAESPMETRLRILLVGGGLPAPAVQYRVVDEYGFVLARVDLAYPAAKLAIEYDGGHHFTTARARRDRVRDADLADLGWETTRCVDDDVLVSPPQTVHRVRRLLDQRAPCLLSST